MGKTSRRVTLSPMERAIVRWKTDGRCHICGGPLGKNWTADHVVPRRRGGQHAVENYLPACQVRNRLRWHYRPDEIKEILQIGIYARNALQHNTKVGRKIRELLEQRTKQKENRRTEK